MWTFVKYEQSLQIKNKNLTWASRIYTYSIEYFVLKYQKTLFFILFGIYFWFNFLVSFFLIFTNKFSLIQHKSIFFYKCISTHFDFIFIFIHAKYLIKLETLLFCVHFTMFWALEVFWTSIKPFNDLELNYQFDS